MPTVTREKAGETNPVILEAIYTNELSHYTRGLVLMDVGFIGTTIVYMVQQSVRIIQNLGRVR